MAQEAVKADAYCIQLVPDKLLTKELCKTALQSPNADDFVKKFIRERFPSLQSEMTKNDEKMQRHTEKSLKYTFSFLPSRLFCWYWAIRSMKHEQA